MNFLLALQQQPIVIETTQQPKPTPEISYGGMLLSAVGLVGVILLVLTIAVGACLYAFRDHLNFDRGGSDNTERNSTA